MKKYFSLVLSSLFLLSCACSSLKGEKADTPENRKAQAESYMKASSFEEMINDSIQEMAKQIPEAHRAEFISAMQKGIKIDALKQVAIESMTKHFTVKELQALTAFYGSPEGKSVMKKFGDYMADVLPAINEQVMQVLQTTGAIAAPQAADKAPTPAQ